MLRLLFSGWCQIRLARDPDPYDDPAGASGRTVALATEPPLDRVIRFQRAVCPRLDAPPVGVDVDAVWDSERRLSGHPLEGSSVDLLDDPVFEGRNGLVADDGHEPILPFVIEIARGPELRVRREDRPAVPWNPLSPDPAALAHRLGLGLEWGPDVAAEVGRTIGVDDPKRWRKRREKVLRDARDAAQGAARLGLDLRLEMLEEVALVRVRYRFPVGRHGDAGEVHDPDGRLPDRIDTRRAWPIDLWFGGWDGDGLVAFVKGELRLPLVP